MRILFALDTYYPRYDGPASVVTNLINFLHKNKLAEADLVAPKYPGYKDEQSFNVYRCPSMVGPDKYRTPLPAFSSKIKKLIKKGNYDLIHIHSPFTLGKYVAKLGKKYNIPVITTLHTNYESDFERKLKSKFLRKFMMKYILKVMNMSDYVCSVSDGAAKMIKEYGYDKEIGVIGNATDLVDDKNLDEQIKSIQERHNLKDKFVFLFVGRVVENKNIQYSLQVMQLLKKAGFSDFKFLIVGQGNYQAELTKLIKEYDLTENVEFTGFVEVDMLCAYYKSANLFMFPSIFDTCGLVVLEAGSFGLPSMLLKGTCASELITDGENGFIVKDDYNMWRDKIIQLIQNREELQEVASKIRSSFTKSWQDITLEYFDLYQKIIDKHNVAK